MSKLLRLGHADYTAGRSAAGVANRLRFQIILFFMNNYRVTENGIFPSKFEHFIFPFEMRFARSVGFEIAEIAHVAFGGIRRAMRFVCGIEMAASRCRIGRGAIAEFVDMKSVFTRCQTGHVRDHLNAIIGFRESDRARHLASRSWVQNGDRFLWLLRRCGEQSRKKDRGNHQYNIGEQISFHVPNLHPRVAVCKL